MPQLYGCAFWIIEPKTDSNIIMLAHGICLFSWRLPIQSGLRLWCTGPAAALLH